MKLTMAPSVIRWIYLNIQPKVIFIDKGMTVLFILSKPFEAQTTMTKRYQFKSKLF